MKLGLDRSVDEDIFWAELPEDVLGLVLGALEWDQLVSARIRLTCRKWRNTHDHLLPVLHLQEYFATESETTLTWLPEVYSGAAPRVSTRVQSEELHRSLSDSHEQHICHTYPEEQFSTNSSSKLEAVNDFCSSIAIHARSEQRAAASTLKESAEGDMSSPWQGQFERCGCELHVTQ